MLTVVGEITESDVHTYLDRRSRRTAYRLDTTLQTDGPSLRMSFFAKSKGVADWQAGRLAVGRRGVFIGQVSTFKGQWQLTNPTMALFGVAGEEGDETTGAAVAAIKALFPLYPLTKGVESWDLQRAVAFALTILDEVPDPLPGPLREAHGLPDPRHRPDVDPPARHVGAGDLGATAVPLRRGARDPAGARPAPGRAGAARWPGPQRWGRAAGGLRRASAVHAHPRAGGGVGRDRGRPRALPPDEPAAPGRGRLRQDARGAAGDAPRGRLGRPGRAPGTDRGPRPAASPLDHRDARRPGGRRHARGPPRRDHRGPAHRVDAQGRAGRGDAPGGERRGRAS